MLTSFQRLLTVLSGSSTADLRRQIQFLKAENQILRSKLPRVVPTTTRERARLVKLGRSLGGAVNELISIVSGRTFRRWVRAHRARPRTRRSTPAVGRPRTAAQIRALILRLARETDWGYTRIQGELLKLGVKISRGTIVNVLKEHHMPRAPERGECTWDQYIRRHAKTLWACDFAVKRIWTRTGLKDAFVLVFIHIASRRVHISPSTTSPDNAWMLAQAEAFSRVVGEVEKETDRGGEPKAAPTRAILLRDRDRKFTRAFDRALRGSSIRPLRLPIRSPNLNAYCERAIQTLQLECLDHFTVMGTTHMDHLVAEYADYYNRQRPHSAIEFRAPAGRALAFGSAAGPPDPARVRCESRLGGLIKHYRRIAA